MVEPRPFLRPVTAARIKALKRRGAATTQLLQDPGATVTFVRAGTPVATGVHLIKIEIDSPSLDVAGAGNGAVEESTIGTARAWATDVASIKADDRFLWQGRKCVVTSIEPERNGTADMRFRLLGAS